MKKETILDVKNLQISFRTISGTVKAVRDISFKLHKGETFAIVGESGSGKSVTSKAILGILAGNAIVESGEILYDGKDILKISEDEMHKLRGDKISMIFQDPLSSLDPIVKIGKQITEAMLLKNNASRKNARREFNTHLALLEAAIIASGDNENPTFVEKVKAICKKFDDFNIKGLQLAFEYTNQRQVIESLFDDVDDFNFRASKKQKFDIEGKLKKFKKELLSVNNGFLISGFESKINDEITRLTSLISDNKTKFSLKGEYAKKVKGKVTEVRVPEEVIEGVKHLQDLCKSILDRTQPDFFRIGYYSLSHDLNEMVNEDINELNEKALKCLDEEFMIEFISLTEKALTYLENESNDRKSEVLERIPGFKDYFSRGEYDKKEVFEKSKELNDIVVNSINKIKINKDSTAYTFGVSLDSSLKSYFYHKKNNIKEEARYARDTAKYDKIITKGKEANWTVVPKKTTELSFVIEDIISLIERLETKYAKYLANTQKFDAHKEAIALIDFFKTQASEVVNKVTKHMAKEKAIELMEEVGIPEPRMRYYQYPFEFSGGMRQRIVIAIALAANPDILICDEPTTALDVTIQSQILELINKLKEERNLSVIFITHDLGVVANMADRIGVMYAGKLVEVGTADDIFYSPAHPYTWALLTSMPDLDTKEKLESIPGTPPNMIFPPKGDAFAARNKYALKIDFEKQPPMFKISDTHYAATWLLHKDAPKIEMPKAISERIKRMKVEGGISDEK